MWSNTFTFRVRMSEWTFLFLYLYLVSETDRSNALKNELAIISSCTCPGFNLTYECTVMGTNAGFTVWRGSAFKCASNDIILRHMRFTSLEGAMGECNKGSIVGRSVRLEPGSIYISQLNIRVNPELIGESIECVLDDTNVTFRLIGNATVNITTDPFLPPSEISVNLTDLSSRRLTFSWSPVAPNCPAIHYNILASSCGSCPTTTNHTTVTCTDVPIEQKTLCTFTLQTVVCGDLSGTLSNPISVSLSGSSSVCESIDYNGNGSGQLASSSSNGFLVAFVSVGVLLAILCVAIFMTIIVALAKTKKRLQSQLASYKTRVEYNVASEAEPISASVKIDTRKNIAYEPNPVAVDTKKNIAYETNTVAVGTN